MSQVPTIQQLISTGMIHPVMNYRFLVEFYNSTGAEKLPFSDNLSMQVINTSQLLQSNGNQFGLKVAAKASITFQDDILSRAMKGAQELINRESFQIRISLLDGGEGIIRQIILKDCSVSQLVHTKLDYAGTNIYHDAELNVKIPEKLGSAIDNLKEDPISNAIITVLEGANFSFNLGKKHIKDSGALEIKMDFQYSSLEFIYPEIK
jgi:hypothetical protein